MATPPENQEPGIETSQLPAARADADLSFLEPSSQSGSLGRLMHYEIRDVIGRGGCGIVLRAFDEKLERIVAIKVMAPELAATSPARKRFLREARATAAVRHENVVSVHAVEEQPLPFLVMEYIDGETLQQRIDRTGPLDVQEVLRIGQRIAQGLVAAHAKGLIHRDIKPGNILLENGTDRLKITDFGLARSADDASLTQSGVIAGTPLYMSPEQALGHDIDQRSDLFSLGSVLYVMCSGRPPFRAATSVAVLRRVVEEQPRPIQSIIPEVPEWLSSIIAKLHAKDPPERFGSAQEVAELLGRCRSELEQHGRVESLPDVLPLLPQPASASSPLAPVLGGEGPGVRGIGVQTARPRSRKWMAAAATILVLLTGLGLSEATGVTNVRGTVIRLFSPEGTLVLEVDDPGVSVSLDGQEIVITGAGVKEIRLEPGQYKLLASKDGKLVSQELVTVTRNGRRVVRVSREADPVVGIRNEPKSGDTVRNHALRFDWGDMVTLPSLPIDRAAPCTMEGYFALSPGRQLDDWGHLLDLSPGFRLDINITKGNFALAADHKDEKIKVDSNKVLVAHQATHIAGVWTGKRYLLFLDGKLVGDREVSAPPLNANRPSTIGNQFVGIIREVRISRTARYDKDFTPARRFEPDADTIALYHCDEGAGDTLIDSSGNGHHGKIFGTRWVNADGSAIDATPAHYTNSLGMEFALVPKGKAWLGGGGGKPGEKKVEFADDFYMGVYEVTQEEWQKVTGSNPSAFARTGVWKNRVNEIDEKKLKRFPVENVSWDDCQLFLARLNAQAKEMGWTYRLPTGEEWEYACRGGPMRDKLDGAFDYYLDKPTVTLAPDQANFLNETGLNRTCQVGSYQPNRLGLFDMHGNVVEWCDGAFKAADGTVLRPDWGGGFMQDAPHCRAIGYKHPPTYRDKSLGLRLVRVSREAEPAIASGNAPKTVSASPAHYTNSLGMEFALVPKGKAWLGGGGGKPGEKKVEFADDFYMGVYEVTQEEWQKVTGSNPSYWSRQHVGDKVKDVTDEELQRFPVDSVSWNDVQLFLARLNERDRQSDWRYRLPTSDEWEYACRGGPMKDPLAGAHSFYFDQPTNTAKPEQGNFGRPQALVGNCPVGRYRPNRLGLYDMHGNVWELCDDEVASADGTQHRVVRGGGWYASPYRTTARQSSNPHSAVEGTGFRLVRVRVTEERKALEWVLSVGGELSVTLKGGPKQVKSVDGLPNGPFQVSSVLLSKAKWTGPIADRLRWLPWVSHTIDLRETEVGDMDVAALAALPGLSRTPTWSLRKTRITDAALRALSGMETLHGVQADGTAVTDAGVKQLAGCPALMHVDLNDTAITDAALEALAAPPKWWTTLHVKGTKVTEVGVKKFAAAYPGCRIEWDGGVIEPTKPSDPDRRAAEYVLSVGGAVVVFGAGKTQLVNPDEQLPTEAFRLIEVRLYGNPLVTDEGLANFNGCVHITSLNLGATQVGQEGLAHFKNCKSLTSLVLGGPRVNDAALAHFKDCKKLGDLAINSSAVTDAGIAYFKDCKDLWSLGLTCRVSDAGLAQFKDCKNLTRLYLSGPLSDAGLAHFQDCKGLKELSLYGSGNVGDGGLVWWAACKDLDVLSFGLTRVSDAGMVHVARCTSVTRLDLRSTRVTDAGLVALAAMPRLKHLQLQGAKVTEAGVQKLATALPQCRIEWDGGVIEPTNSADPDRRAAEWVLSIGGRVQANGRDLWITMPDDLPAGRFTLTRADLTACKEVTDAGLACFDGCKNLTSIVLSFTKVTDAGLAHFKDCKNLSLLRLDQTQVGDAGLVHFKDCKDLRHLWLGRTRVTDAGLAHFKDCKYLLLLSLVGTQVSDAGLAHFKDCTKLADLNLDATHVGDAGLVHFKDCKHLTGISLRHTKVGDAGLAHFKGCAELKHLNLNDTQVTDAGLAALRDCKRFAHVSLINTRVTDAGLAHLVSCDQLANLSLDGTNVSDASVETLSKFTRLTALTLARTKVTEAGAKRLAAALPGCQIAWDGGVIEPKQPAAAADPDRRAAEWVLSMGGAVNVRVAGQEQRVETRVELPAEAFQLSFVYLMNNRRVGDDGLAVLKGCQGIWYLDVRGTLVTDAGLAHLKDCTSIEDLRLSNNLITDAGLAHFRDCKRLSGLDLAVTQITDAGLATLKNCKYLVSLALGKTRVTDAGLAHFKDCRLLEALSLYEAAGVTDAGLAHFKDCRNLKMLFLGLTSIGDAGMAHFKDCTSITNLDMRQTQITDAGLATVHDFRKLTHLDLRGAKRVTANGVAAVQKALPQCRIEWDGGVFEPKTTAAAAIDVLASPDYEWSAAVNLGPVVNSGGRDIAPAISGDNLSLMFVSNRSGDLRLYEARKKHTSEPWGEPAAVPDVNGNSPFLSTDGLTLLYSQTGGHGGEDLMTARRSRRDAAWGKVANLGPTVNSSDNDRSPALSIHGLTLYFESDREGGAGGFDLWMSRRETVNSAFGKPVNLGRAINTPENELQPCPSGDDRHLVFVRLADNKSTLHIATRAAGGSWTAQPMDMPGGLAWLGEPALSIGGSTLYFETDRLNGQGESDLWFSFRRQKKPAGAAAVSAGATPGR